MSRIARLPLRGLALGIGWISPGIRTALTLAAGYAHVPAEPPQRTRARGGIVLMIGLTVFDYSVSRRLRRAETS